MKPVGTILFESQGRARSLTKTMKNIASDPCRRALDPCRIVSDPCQRALDPCRRALDIIS